jgi:glc operon protein GlcG
MASTIEDIPDGALTEQACARALTAAREHAASLGVRVSVAVHDAGGHLLAFIRMDDVHAGTVEVSMGKARCAVMFNRPTKAFADALAAGASGIAALPGVIPFEGGVPVTHEGKLFGAVGCSGASPQQDGEIARAAVHAATHSEGCAA